MDFSSFCVFDLITQTDPVKLSNIFSGSMETSCGSMDLSVGLTSVRWAAFWQQERLPAAPRCSHLRSQPGAPVRVMGSAKGGELKTRTKGPQGSTARRRGQAKISTNCSPLKVKETDEKLGIEFTIRKRFKKYLESIILAIARYKEDLCFTKEKYKYFLMREGSTSVKIKNSDYSYYTKILFSLIRLAK